MDEIDRNENARSQIEACEDCGGKGYFVAAEDFIAHTCPTCGNRGGLAA